VEPARLWRVPLESAATPWQAALALRGDERPFALTGRWAGGGAVLGSAPVDVLGAADDAFAALARQPPVDGAEAPGGAVGGGWFGFLGFGLGARLERVPPAPPRPVPLPDAALAFYDHVLRRDADGGWWFEALWTDARAAALRRRLDELRARLASADRLGGGRAALGRFAAVAPGPRGHLDAVAACRERIAAGELFQANLCLRLEASWDGEPEALFARAAAALRPDRAALVAAPWGAIVSLSPELFLERRGREVRTAPIKGTAPLDGREGLERSAKDRAENVMIADLMRNDLGRVCTYGSVVVEALAEGREHAGVWHLVSEVRGRLRDDAGDDDLVRACFPPGSVTGAPKVQALRVISELEATGREAYTGAVGFASPVAGLELSVAIRTFELAAGRAWLGVGGGVTWGSDPEAELEECLVKARPLLAAAGAEMAAAARGERSVADLAGGERSAAIVGGGERSTAIVGGGERSTAIVGGGERSTAIVGGGERSTAASRSAARRGAGDVAIPRALTLGAPAERPDPACGVFTTVLVAGGVPVDLDAHLGRLAASAAALGVDAPRGELAAAARAAAADAGGGRLRIALAAGAPPAVATGPPPPPAGLVRLAPVLLPGGLGAHKWSDRRLLDALAARLGAVPLVVDADGAVLEAAWAAVLLVEGDALVAPPLDGRLLPSTARARVAAGAAALGLGVRAEPLDLARVAGADAVLVASALRGPVPAALAGEPTPALAPAAAELARAWAAATLRGGPVAAIGDGPRR
jgi:para-aminobenzoate synthetase/4-amino-4-deoxychorismate lyase